jgi:starch-binding outer membrane protein SusE/F
MKNIFNKLLLCVFPALIWSCEKKENRALLQVGTAQVLTVSANSFSISKPNASKEVMIAAWNAANYGYPSAPVYTIQFDKQGGNFAAAYEISMGSSKGKTFTQGELNEAFIRVGYEPDLPATVIMRIKSSVSQYAPLQYSNTVNLSATPYSTEPPSLYVPGAYQNWDPGSATRIWAFGSDTKKFDGYIVTKDPDTKFKLTTKPNWIVNYGDEDGGGASGKLKLGGSDILAASKGLNRLEVDLNANTYKLTPLPGGWGIIGSAVAPYDWSADQDMIFDPATGIWSITITMADAEFKFRANNTWADEEFGDGGGGLLKYKGSNLKVPNGAGTYKVELILTGPDPFSYKITKQ